MCWEKAKLYFCGSSSNSAPPRKTLCYSLISLFPWRFCLMHWFLPPLHRRHQGFHFNASKYRRCQLTASLCDIFACSEEVTWVFSCVDMDGRCKIKQVCHLSSIVKMAGAGQGSRWGVDVKLTGAGICSVLSDKCGSWRFLYICKRRLFYYCQHLPVANITVVLLQLSLLEDTSKINVNISTEVCLAGWKN